MFIVDEILVSDELKYTYFTCNLKACHGDCCVEGDAGAPLEEEEISILEDNIENIKPYMTKEGIEIIEQYGVFDYDTDGEFVTPLVNNRECAFVYFKNNIAFCAVEKAWLEGKIKFQKPVSCHLYPVRIDKVGDRTAVNYHRWSICVPALKYGRDTTTPLYKYLKIPLIRKFGEKWYQKLVDAIENEQ
jgi:hypothetical protein